MWPSGAVAGWPGCWPSGWAQGRAAVSLAAVGCWSVERRIALELGLLAAMVARVLRAGAHLCAPGRLRAGWTSAQWHRRAVFPTTSLARWAGRPFLPGRRMVAGPPASTIRHHFVVLLIDVDHFEARERPPRAPDGDEVLRSIAECCMGCCGRATCWPVMAARFIAVLPCIDHGVAWPANRSAGPGRYQHQLAWPVSTGRPSA